MIVPFVPIAPPAQQLAGVPACVGARLRASVNVQGATGSELGVITIRNVGTRACVLRSPIRIVRLDGAGRKLRFVSQYGEHGLGYRALRLEPRHAATVGIQLMNACSTKPGELWIDRPRVDLHIPPEGRCDVPRAPAIAYMGDLDRIVVRRPAHVLRVVSVDVPARAASGGLLDYTVTVSNPTAHFWRGTALYGEELDLYDSNLVVTRQYELPVHMFAPHTRMRFAMRLPLPRRRDRGAEVDWSLLDNTEPIAPMVRMDDLLNSFIDLASYSWVHSRQIAIS